MKPKRSSLPIRTIARLTSCLLLFSCEPGGPSQPEPSTALITVKQDLGADPSGPLRLAVVWQQGWGADQHWLTTYDVPTRLGQSHQRATLVLPPAAQRSGLTDRSVGYFACSAADEKLEAPVLFPRIVVYEDLDGSGDLNPDLPLAPGSDRIWGVSTSRTEQSAIAAFSDLEQLLSALPLESAECLRGVTNDTYSAFFQGRVEKDQWVPSEGAPSAFVGLSSSDYARVAMNCPTGSESVLHISPSNVMGEPSSRWVESSVATDPCAEDSAPCTRGAGASLVLPELTSYADRGYKRSAQCYVLGRLDVLLLKEFRLVCEGCSCHWNQRNSSWVADRARLPVGWPCGARLQYCSAPAAALWVEPSSCALGGSRPQ